jgi:hypothetical protein
MEQKLKVPPVFRIFSAIDHGAVLMWLVLGKLFMWLKAVLPQT